MSAFFNILIYLLKKRATGGKSISSKWNYLFPRALIKINFTIVDMGRFDASQNVPECIVNVFRQGPWQHHVFPSLPILLAIVITLLHPSCGDLFISDINPFAWHQAIDALGSLSPKSHIRSSYLVLDSDGNPAAAIII